MGAGIAQVCVQAGIEVVGREVDPELGERGRQTIDHYLARGVEKGRLREDEKDAALGRLSLVTDLGELASCGLVIEAAFEDLDVKRALFAELDVLVEPRVSPEDVDRAMRFGANWPIGPCALIDLIGVDVHVHASEALHAALAEERMAPPQRLLEMQQAGQLGRKSGHGFYDYEPL